VNRQEVRHCDRTFLFSGIEKMVSIKLPDGAVKQFDIWSTATFVRQKNKWRIAATHISMTELK